MVTDKVIIYLKVKILKLTYMYNKIVFMFTHAIENNAIITFINNLINVALRNVTIWNYIIIRILLQQIRFYSTF